MPEPKPEEPISYPERVARLVAARKWPDIAAQSGIQFAAHVALVRQAVIEVLDAVKRLRDAERPALGPAPEDDRLSDERLRAHVENKLGGHRLWDREFDAACRELLVRRDAERLVCPEDYGLKRPEMPSHAMCPHCGR